MSQRSSSDARNKRAWTCPDPGNRDEYCLSAIFGTQPLIIPSIILRMCYVYFHASKNGLYCEMTKLKLMFQVLTWRLISAIPHPPTNLNRLSAAQLATQPCVYQSALGSSAMQVRLECAK